MKANPINTRKGKRQFINEFFASMKKKALANVPRMPAEWDGHELRELLADMFEHERTLRKDARTRRTEYENNCCVRNIY